MKGGAWYGRTTLDETRRWGERVDLEDFAEPETVHLAPRLCWQGLSEDELREHLAALVETIERENSELRMVEGKSLLGVKALFRRHPHDRPKKLSRSPVTTVVP